MTNRTRPNLEPIKICRSRRQAPERQNVIVRFPIDRTKKEHRYLSRMKKQAQNIEAIKAGDLKFTVNIPQFIIDNYMIQMSPTSWKLFCYICRCATFDPKNIHFGTCRLTHHKIEEIIGIKKSNMLKYVRELEELGMLRVKIIQKREGNEIITIHHYEVPFFKIREDQ